MVKVLTQAKKFNFNEAEYINALSEVPIIDENKLPNILSYLVGFANLIATMGLDKVRIEESEKKHHKHLEELVAKRTKELKLAKEEAERANKSKSVFLANMSHELRTPLNSILGFSNLLSTDSNLSNKQKETLNIINQSGEYLLSMINEILDISKIEAGKINIESTTFDLYQLLNDIIDFLTQKATSKELYLNIEFNLNVNRYIKTDAKKLKQIILRTSENFLDLI